MISLDSMKHVSTSDEYAFSGRSSLFTIVRENNDSLSTISRILGILSATITPDLAHFSHFLLN
jgi:hypothetical protein